MGLLSESGPGLAGREDFREGRRKKAELKEEGGSLIADCGDFRFRIADLKAGLVRVQVRDSQSEIRICSCRDFTIQA